jgi:hypothetical protein
MRTAEVAIYPFPATKSSACRKPSPTAAKAPEKPGIPGFSSKGERYTGKTGRICQNS